MFTKFLRGALLAGVATASLATMAAPATAATTTEAKAVVQAAAPAQAQAAKPVKASEGVLERRRHYGWCDGRRRFACRYPTWLPYAFAGSYYDGFGPYYYYGLDDFYFNGYNNWGFGGNPWIFYRARGYYGPF